MAKYDLPALPKNCRWYLARHSKVYANLKLQHKEWWGWKCVAEELVDVTERKFSLDVALKTAADDILRILEAPKVSYGVIT